jgi:CheY-like chemotaxis protein
MKLLVIDDEPHIRQMMRLTLEAAGYQVDEAATGEAGLALYEQHGASGRPGSYDTVLLDQKMPGIDGLQTLKQLKARDPGVRVIMVTAFASIDLAVDAMRLGATDFLRKPMTPEMLRGAVAAALETRPRTPLKEPGPEGPPPRIETRTLNGFRILEPAALPDPMNGTHVFRIRHFHDATESSVIVSIDPEAISRVARLSGRHLQPGGTFWRNQAQHLLAAYLWSEGRPPESGRLTVRDVSREELDAAANWLLD